MKHEQRFRLPADLMWCGRENNIRITHKGKIYNKELSANKVDSSLFFRKLLAEELNLKPAV
jgi:hypothetical protein